MCPVYGALDLSGEDVVSAREALMRGSEVFEGDQNISAMRAAALFKIMVPRRFGGLEPDRRTKLDVYARVED